MKWFLMCVMFSNYLLAQESQKTAYIDYQDDDLKTHQIAIVQQKNYNSLKKYEENFFKIGLREFRCEITFLGDNATIFCGRLENKSGPFVDVKGIEFGSEVKCDGKTKIAMLLKEKEKGKKAWISNMLYVSCVNQQEKI